MVRRMFPCPFITICYLWRFWGDIWKKATRHDAQIQPQKNRGEELLDLAEHKKSRGRQYINNVKKWQGSHVLVEGEECSPEHHEHINNLLLYSLLFLLAKTDDLESDWLPSGFHCNFACFEWIHVHSFICFQEHIYNYQSQLNENHPQHWNNSFDYMITLVTCSLSTSE